MTASARFALTPDLLGRYPAHPASQGYICEKATQLDRYQNGRDRLTSPMRRTAAGTYEPVDWDTAIAEVAARLVAVRDTHGGDATFHYGGGVQGNHLIGAYGRATRAALGSRYTKSRTPCRTVTPACPMEPGSPTPAGIAPNELTASEDKDWLAGTPWHKHVRARIEAI